MRSRSYPSILACGLVAAAVGLASWNGVVAEEREAAGKPLRVERLHDLDGAPAPAQPAGLGKRYAKLLRQVAAPDDQKSYGDYYDYGYYTGTSWAGQNDLPPGFWVYIAPNWYIFGEAPGVEAAAVREPRAWGPERATGAPDTPEAGDQQTAWASLSADGQREWLELGYDKPVKAVAVLVYETFNPGAVDRVQVFSADAKQQHCWNGADPVPAGRDKGVSVIPMAAPFEVSRVRIELDSARVKGWNEIDAVGLVDEAGVTHWATNATASSTYAEPQDEIKGVRLSAAVAADGVLR